MLAGMFKNQKAHIIKCLEISSGESFKKLNFHIHFLCAFYEFNVFNLNLRFKNKLNAAAETALVIRNIHSMKNYSERIDRHPILSD